MSGKPRVKFYLVHLETGQRYPVADEVVIGRSSGDLLFPDDAKLSAQHCRLLMTDTGVGVHDLGSGNGTRLEGKTLQREKAYMFKVGNVLEVGEQAFKLTEASYARKVRSRRGDRRRNERRAQSRGDGVALVFAGLLAIAALYLGTRYYFTSRRPAAAAAADAGVVTLESPFDMVDREVRAVLDAYRELGAAHAGGSLNEKEVAERIRRSLLPDMTRVQNKLGAIRGMNEAERRRLDLTRRMVDALVGQLTAMAEVNERGDAGARERLRRYTETLESLKSQLKQAR